jgi:hypothetical protein
MGDFKIQFDAKDLSKKIKDIDYKFSSKDYTGLTMILQIAATKMAGWAKVNKPWTTRTGDAQRRLTGRAYWEDSKTVTAVVEHQVHYGVWLELARQGKYAILEKSIEEHKIEILESVAIYLEKVIK